MLNIKNIGLIGKYNSSDILPYIVKLSKFLEDLKLTVFLDDQTKYMVKEKHLRFLSLDNLVKKVDLIVVFGGDGTMLNVARIIAPFDVPVVGINLGRIGFLTDLSLDNMKKSLKKIIDGDYVKDPRLLLETDFHYEGAEKKFLSLNEVSISKGSSPGLIELQVKVNDEFLYYLRSDGLIISTPTGSTAYALSAGGPIIRPSLHCFSIVPVSPHTLSNRPIVVDSESIIEVTLLEGSNVLVSFDGHDQIYFRKKDKLLIKKFNNLINLIHPKGHSYFHTLREKLHWSGSI